MRVETRVALGLVGKLVFWAFQRALITRNRQSQQRQAGDLNFHLVSHRNAFWGGKMSVTATKHVIEPNNGSIERPTSGGVLEQKKISKILHHTFYKDFLSKNQ